MYQDSQVRSSELLQYDPKASIVLSPLGSQANEPFILSAEALSHKMNNLNIVVRDRDAFIAKIDKVRDFIIDSAKSEGEVSEDLQQVAEILDIDLDTEVEIEMTIRYTATVCVPLGYKVSSDDFEICIDYNGEGFCNYEDFTIDDFENGSY